MEVNYGFNLFEKRSYVSTSGLYTSIDMICLKLLIETFFLLFNCNLEHNTILTMISADQL